MIHGRRSQEKYLEERGTVTSGTVQCSSSMVHVIGKRSVVHIQSSRSESRVRNKGGWERERVGCVTGSGEKTVSKGRQKKKCGHTQWGEATTKIQKGILVPMGCRSHDSVGSQAWQGHMENRCFRSACGGDVVGYRADRTPDVNFQSPPRWRPKCCPARSLSDICREWQFNNF